VDGIPEEAIRLDVRNPGELETWGAIPGFINIPLNELRGRMDELDLSRPIYVTCQVGLRGHVACRMLAQHGATAYNLSGGCTLYAAYVKDLQGLADKGGVSCASCGEQVKG
jgi:rhodanese-related sulfurtransferase